VNRRFGLGGKGALLAAGIVAMAACGGTSAENPSPSPSATAASTPSAQASASPTALDPCQLVTAGEASTVAGVTFGAGKEDNSAGGPAICTYGGQTANVFMVIVSQASDAATAQATWDQQQADAVANLKKAFPELAGLNLNAQAITVAGADRAATIRFSTTLGGQAVGIVAIYLLKGPVFLSFSDLTVGHAPPTEATVEAQAQTSLGRIP
jgi:Protein of unknown function (DUF3558)